MISFLAFSLQAHLTLFSGLHWIEIYAWTNKTLRIWLEELKTQPRNLSKTSRLNRSKWHHRLKRCKWISEYSEAQQEREKNKLIAREVLNHKHMQLKPFSPAKNIDVLALINIKRLREKSDSALRSQIGFRFSLVLVGFYIFSEYLFSRKT